MAASDLTITILGTEVLAGRLGMLSNALAGSILRDAMLAGAGLVVHEAQRLAPVKTGTLRDSLRAGVIESSRLGCTVQVGTSVPYARMVEEGTRAHGIDPTVKQALWWPTALHPVKHVNHPGTKARPFLIPALTDNADRVEAVVMTSIQLLLDSV